MSAMHLLPMAIRGGLALMMAALAAILGFVYLRFSRWNMSGLFFGVTVDAHAPDSPQGRDALAKYRVTIVATTALAILISIAAVLPANAGICAALLMAGLIVQNISAVLAFRAAHQKMLPFSLQPSNVREASLEPRSVTLPGGALGQLTALAPLILACIVLALRWPSIPQRFPVHFDLYGNPNRWASKTFAGVFMLPIIGLALCIFTAVIGWLTGAYMRHSSGVMENRQMRLFHVFQNYLVIVECILSVGFGAMSLVMTSANLHVQTVGMLMASGLMTLAVLLSVVYLLYTLKRNSELSAGAVASLRPQAVGDGTPDFAWKWGLFYCNRNDPAVFVPKRLGIGYTVNFANPTTWWLSLGLLAFCAGIALLGLLVH